jgi:hypothetical protein
LKFQGVGQLQAKEIFFLFAESPPTAKGQQSQPRAKHLLARNDVHMNSPELSSKVEQMEVWFEEGAGGWGPGSVASERPGTAVPGVMVGAGVEGRGMGGSPPIASPVGAAVQLPPQQGAQPPPQQTVAHRFEVVGRLLRARVLLAGQQAAVSNLTIEDGVRFLETQTAQPGEQPLMIRGDRLEAENPSAPNGIVTVTGRPARFEGRGLGLTGSNINLNRGTNRLWIDGPGQMDRPMPADPQGPALVAPGVLTIDWQRRMEFDGNTAQFDEGVVVATPQQQLRTETMLVRLQRPISFSEPNVQGTPQIEEIQCHGGVSMENRTLNQQQQLSSYDRMQVTDLAVNVQSGALTAGGPGWLNSVRRGSDQPFSGPTAPARGNAPAQDQLNCLHVKFQKSITGYVPSGNLLRRQLTFADQVKMAYAPVDNWDAMLTTDNPDKLGPNGVVISCDRLSVVEMLLPVGGRRAIELEALGNTRVDGTTFTATGNRITYAEAKDLLILQGDSRSDARLFRQLETGAERSEAAAQEMHYWPKTKRLNIIGAQSLQIGQPPNVNKQR